VAQVDVLIEKRMALLEKRLQESQATAMATLATHLQAEVKRREQLEQRLSDLSREQSKGLLEMRALVQNLQATCDQQHKALINTEPQVDALKPIRAQVHQLQEVIAGLQAQTGPIRRKLSDPHKYQANVIIEQDHTPNDVVCVEEPVDTEPMPFSTGDVVTIQLANTDKFLQYAKRTTALPTEHFGFSPVDTRMNSRYYFVIHDTTDNQLVLRSAFKGGVLVVKEMDEVYEDGYLVTLSPEQEEDAQLTILTEGEFVRLVGPNNAHLSCVSISTEQGPYDLLATFSIMPEPEGLFLIKCVQ
jgi:hypothetical protein